MTDRDREAGRADVAGWRQAVVVAAAGVAVVALVAVAVVQRDDGAPTAAASPGTEANDTAVVPVADRPFVGTQWLLVEATVDGEPVPFEDDPPPSLVIDDAERFSQYDGCNHQGGEATLAAGQLRVGNLASTLVGCVAPPGQAQHISTVIGEVVGSTPRYEIDGDTLTLTSGDARLTYEASDELFTPTDAQILEQGELGGVPYRVTWSSDGGSYWMELQRRTGDQQPQGGSGVGTGIDDPEINLMKVDARGSSLLFGLVPSSAARATYQAEDGEPVDLELRVLDGAEPGYVGVLAEVDGGRRWTVTAYDEAGVEVDQLRWG